MISPTRVVKEDLKRTDLIDESQWNEYPNTKSTDLIGGKNLSDDRNDQIEFNSECSLLKEMKTEPSNSFSSPIKISTSVSVMTAMTTITNPATTTKGKIILDFRCSKESEPLEPFAFLVFLI